MKIICRLGLYFAAVAIMAAAPMLVAGIALVGFAIYHAMTWDKQDD